MQRFVVKTIAMAAVALTAHVGLVALLANTVHDPIVTNGRAFTSVPLQRPVTGYSLLRFREVEDFGRADVVVVGSSHAYRSFDTAWLGDRGVRAFNLGSTSQVPVVSARLLERYLEPLDPDVVIVDVYSEVMRLSGTESLVDLLRNRGVTPDLVRAAADLGTIEAWNAVLVHATSVDTWHVDQRDVEQTSNNGIYVAGGFVRRERLRREDRDFRDVPGPFADSQIEGLARIARLVEQSGRRLVFVATPLPYATLAQIDDYDVFRSIVSDVASAHDATFLDFNGEASVPELHDPALYFDADHLNARGVDAFMPHLARAAGLIDPNSP